MKELEVGMYVRTTYGRIYKIKKVETKKVYYSCNPLELQWQDREFVYSESGMESETAISKASNNLIDLIEEGDLIETPKGIFQVGYIENNVIYTDNSKVIACLREDKHLCFENTTIVSIVTKEQFDSMKYVVGDKE